MNLQEAISAFRADQGQLSDRGIVLPDAIAYMPAGWKRNWQMALDAQPQLVTAPNSAIPAIFTTLIDPDVVRVLFAPTQAAEIYGEVKKGSWVDDTIMFQVVESAGEVSSYGDYNNNGHATVNVNWPNRQNYRYQTMIEYGELEAERAGAAKLNWVSELNASAASVMNRFANLSYFFGIVGLQNYGALNAPGFTAPLTPAPKAYGGTKWVVNNVVMATANEIFNDIQSLYLLLIGQTFGLINAKSELVLALSPQSEGALTQTNSFAVNVNDLLKKNFPNLSIVTAVQFGALAATNPQGVAAGEYMQLFAKTFDGQTASFVAFSEKMRTHRLIPAPSSHMQKISGGTWGFIGKYPYAYAGMVGL